MGCWRGAQHGHFPGRIPNSQGESLRENPPDLCPRQALRPGHVLDPFPPPPAGAEHSWSGPQHPRPPAPNRAEQRAPSRSPLRATSPSPAPKPPGVPAPRRCTRAKPRHGSGAREPISAHRNPSCPGRRKGQRAFSRRKLLATPSSWRCLQRAKVRWLQVNFFSLFF